MKTQYNIKELNVVSDVYHETCLLISHEGTDYISTNEVKEIFHNRCVSECRLPLPITRRKKKGYMNMFVGLPYGYELHYSYELRRL